MERNLTTIGIAAVVLAASACAHVARIDPNDDAALSCAAQAMVRLHHQTFVCIGVDARAAATGPTFSRTLDPPKEFLRHFTSDRVRPLSECEASRSGVVHTSTHASAVRIGIGPMHRSGADAAEISAWSMTEPLAIRFWELTLSRVSADERWQVTTLKPMGEADLEWR